MPEEQQCDAGPHCFRRGSNPNFSALLKFNASIFLEGYNHKWTSLMAFSQTVLAMRVSTSQIFLLLFYATNLLFKRFWASVKTFSQTWRLSSPFQGRGVPSRIPRLTSPSQVPRFGNLTKVNPPKSFYFRRTKHYTFESNARFKTARFDIPKLR